MDKTEANKRLAAIESEAAQLRELINAKQSPIAKGHNPDKLTEAQVGEGWRLLSEDEVGRHGIDKSLVEYLGSGRWRVPATDYSSAFLDCTYRTQKPEGYFLPKREPKAGDIWISQSGANYLMDDEGSTRLISVSPDFLSYRRSYDIPLENFDNAEYRGTFDEVYIERDKVQGVIKRALAHEDSDGATLDSFSAMWPRAKCQAVSILKELL